MALQPVLPIAATAGTIPSYDRYERLLERGKAAEITETQEGRCIPILFGKVKLRPNLIHAEIESDVTLHLVYLLGEGELQAVNKITLEGDEIYPGTANASWATVTVKLGTTAQAEDTSIPDASWTSSLPGYAYVHVEINLLVAELASGEVPSIECEVSGIKLYDHRVTATQFSENPILACVELLRNAEFGLGIADAEIDFVSVDAAADVCDVRVP